MGQIHSFFQCCDPLTKYVNRLSKANLPSDNSVETSTSLSRAPEATMTSYSIRPEPAMTAPTSLKPMRLIPIKKIAPVPPQEAPEALRYPMWPALKGNTSPLSLGTLACKPSVPASPTSSYPPLRRSVGNAPENPSSRSVEATGPESATVEQLEQEQLFTQAIYDEKRGRPSGLLIRPIK